MAAKFKHGDVVRLNSGGPAMTVSVPPPGDRFDRGADEVYVVWIDGTKKCSAWFNEVAMSAVPSTTMPLGQKADSMGPTIKRSPPCVHDFEHTGKGDGKKVCLNCDLVVDTTF